MKTTLLLALQGINAFQTPPPRRPPVTRHSTAFRQRRAWSGPAYPPPRPVFERGPTRQPPPTFRECVAFTAPALAIYVAGPLMSLIDAGFVGRRSSFELAALGPAGTISDSMTTLLVFLSVATTDLVARARCGGDDDECDLDAASRAATTGLLLAGLVGVLVGGSLVLGAMPVCLSYSKGADLARAAAPYVAVRAMALPAALIASVAQAACLGLRDATTPGLSVAIAAALNLMGDFVLVPRQGLLGAAIATAASQYAAALLLVLSLKRKGVVGRACFAIKDRFKRIPTSVKRDIRPFFALGPFVFCSMMKLLLHNSSAMTAAALDATQTAAHTVVFSVAMFCFVVGDVGTSLALAYLPRFVGDGEGRRLLDTKAAQPTVRQVLRAGWCLSAVCVLASTLVVLRGSLLTSDRAVQRAIARCLPLTVLNFCFHATAVTSEGALLATRDLGFLCTWYAGLGVAVLAAHRFILARGLGLPAIWLTYFGVQFSRAVVFPIRAGMVARPAWTRRRSASLAFA